MPEGVELAVLNESIRLLAILPEGVAILLPEGVPCRSKSSGERRIFQLGLIGLGLHPPSNLSGRGPFSYYRYGAREHENSLPARCRRSPPSS